MGRALDRDLPLLHRLEQRRLGPRRRPVDLVDEQDVREDRPGHEPQPLGLEDARAGDVAREQVRRALDAGRPQVEGARDRAGEERLAGPGHVLDEDVAVGEQRDEHVAERIVDADDGLADLAAEVVPEPATGVRLAAPSGPSSGSPSSVQLGVHSSSASRQRSPRAGGGPPGGSRPARSSRRRSARRGGR